MTDADRIAEKHRDIQREVDDKTNPRGERNGHAMQAGAHRYPEPPLPEQHLNKPGHERELDIKPM